MRLSDGKANCSLHFNYVIALSLQKSIIWDSLGTDSHFLSCRMMQVLSVLGRSSLKGLLIWADGPSSLHVDYSRMSISKGACMNEHGCEHLALISAQRDWLACFQCECQTKQFMTMLWNACGGNVHHLVYDVSVTDFFRWLEDGTRKIMHVNISTDHSTFVLFIFLIRNLATSGNFSRVYPTFALRELG